MNMKQVVVDNQSGAVAVNEVPLPVINGRGIVVQSLYSVISSGTELSMIRSSRAGKLERLKKMMPEDGLAAYFRRKIQSGTLFQSTASVARSIQRGNQGPGGRYLPLGYSLSGIVQAVDGNVAGVSVGDKVACGGARHADRNYVPLNLFTRIPEAVDPRESAFTTIGCIALQGVRRARLAHGETVAVIGQGLIGQLVTQLVKINGGAVIATDISRRKLGMSLRMGADLCINSAECDPVQEILNYTGWQGVDAAIICAASATSAPLRQALAMVRDKGRIVLVGAVKIEMPRDPLYTKELDFFISRSYGPGRYDPVYEQKGFDYPLDQVRWTENRNMEEINRLLAEKRLNVRDLITHEFAVSDAAKAYETIAREPDAALGILLRYDPDDAGTADAPKVYPAPVPASREEKRIRTAIIGCGSFARKYHLPNIRKIPALRLEAIVTATGLSARQIAETYTIPSCTTDYRALLSRQDIDAVVISTRHHLHATMAQEALAAGKHVFLEKPMALNKDELRTLTSAIQESSALFTVGFNRRFSPLSAEIKKALVHRKRPMIINYRVANTLQPETSWVHDPEEGGGAILGECCHFFDLVHWFVGVEPVSLFAEGGNTAHPGGRLYDTALITLRFADDSVATITFIDQGQDGFPKERIELFSDAGVMVLNPSTIKAPASSGTNAAAAWNRGSSITSMISLLNSDIPRKNRHDTIKKTDITCAYTSFASSRL
jgi:predicted dehydrogenase/threonine dehydrogenase-like Zn-dependent dehydrogenase